MFKRLFWLVMGAAFGFGVSFWLMRFVRETMTRYSPERVSVDLADTLRNVAREFVEGMRDAEADLRSRIEPTR